MHPETKCWLPSLVTVKVQPKPEVLIALQAAVCESCGELLPHEVLRNVVAWMDADAGGANEWVRRWNMSVPRKVRGSELCRGM